MVYQGRGKSGNEADASSGLSAVVGMPGISDGSRAITPRGRVQQSTRVVHCRSIKASRD